MRYSTHYTVDLIYSINMAITYNSIKYNNKRGKKIVKYGKVIKTNRKF